MIGSASDGCSLDVAVCLAREEIIKRQAAGTNDQEEYQT
jgi:hypothetical protein